MIVYATQLRFESEEMRVSPTLTPEYKFLAFFQSFFSSFYFCDLISSIIYMSQYPLVYHTYFVNLFSGENQSALMKSLLMVNFILVETH